MEHIFDKLAILACCAACAVVFSAGVGAADMGTLAAEAAFASADAAAGSAAGGVSAQAAAFVAALLFATTLSCAQELLPAAVRMRGAVALSAAFCLAALVVPACVPFTPLFVYDLAVRTRAGWGACALVPLLAQTGAGRCSVLCAVAVGAIGVLSLMLAVRTRAVVEGSLRSRQARDALQARSLSLEEANRDLLDRQEREARMAVLEERGRIAREIHDNVGHLLTRSILQTEAYRVVHADDAAVRDEFEQVGATLHEALDTVRASVHNLRDDSIDLSVQVAALAEASAVPVRSETSVGSAPPEVAACLTAIVREALSNAARHSNATRIDLALIEHPGMWQLSVRDNGTVPPAADGRSRGMGLQSMEERTRALGGLFRSGWRDGFEVFVSIPKKGRQTAPGEAGATGMGGSARPPSAAGADGEIPRDAEGAAGGGDRTTGEPGSDASGEGGAS